MTRTESLGSIIERMMTNLIKLYMQEEIRHNDPDPKKRLEASDKITILNKQRYLFITAINELIDKQFAQREIKDYDRD